MSVLESRARLSVTVPDWMLRGGTCRPTEREDKLKLDLPPRFKVEPIGPNRTLSEMLAAGEIDALHTARAPSTFYSRPDKVRRLFQDFVAVEKDYYARTGIFPIMHVVAIRRDIYERNRWIARSLYKAFVRRNGALMLTFAFPLRW